MEIVLSYANPAPGFWEERRLTASSELVIGGKILTGGEKAACEPVFSDQPREATIPPSSTTISVWRRRLVYRLRGLRRAKPSRPGTKRASDRGSGKPVGGADGPVGPVKPRDSAFAAASAS